MPPQGWEWKRFPFILVIDRNGRFQGFKDTREGEGKARSPRSFLVPSLGEGKGGGIKANLLWENMEYLLGIPKDGSDPQRVARQHEDFHRQGGFTRAGRPRSPRLPGFPRLPPFRRAPKLSADRDWEKVASEALIFTVEVDGFGILTDLPEVSAAIDIAERIGTEGICLVSGARDRSPTCTLPSVECAVRNQVVPISRRE